MAPGRRLRWSPNLVRVALAGHSLLGLVFGALVYQVCLTGTVSVFSAELKRWEQPNAPVVDAVSPEGYAAAAAAALARPEARGKTIVLFGPTDARPRFEVRVPGAGDNALADKEGSAVGGVSTPWTELVVSLHEELHLPYPWGTLVIALTGAILLALVINGICAHPRIFRDAFHLRLGGASRLSEADTHNRLSVWGLPFHIAVTLTGTILALAGVLGPLLVMLAYGGDIDRGLREVLGPQPSYQRMEPMALPEVAALIRRVEVERAPAKVSFIEIQQAGTAGQVLHIDTGAPGHLASGESYVFSGEGAYLGSIGYSDGPAGKQMIAALTPLHFGTFAGLPIRLIYGALGLALCAICATGVNIWLIRRRESGSSYAAWNRTWIAVVWGQPIALAGAAVAPAGIGPLLSYVTITTTLLLLAAVPMAALSLRTWMRFATAAALVAVAVNNVLKHGTLPADVRALEVNGALIGGGVLLGLLAWRFRPPPKRAEP